MGSADLLDATPPVAGDPWQTWLDAHRAEVARHRGQRIAVHRTEGIIASGETCEALSDALTRMGYSPGRRRRHRDRGRAWGPRRVTDRIRPAMEPVLTQAGMTHAADVGDARASARDQPKAPRARRLGGAAHRRACRDHSSWNLMKSLRNSNRTRGGSFRSPLSPRVGPGSQLRTDRRISLAPIAPARFWVHRVPSPRGTTPPTQQRDAAATSPRRAPRSLRSCPSTTSALRARWRAPCAAPRLSWASRRRASARARPPRR